MDSPILTLECLIGPGSANCQSAKIEILLRRARDLYLDLIVIVQVGPGEPSDLCNRASVAVPVSGYDVANFVSQLKSLHTSLHGSARLLAEGANVLCLTSSNPRTGQVVIGGLLQEWPSYLHAQSSIYDKRTDSGAFSVRFDGFEVDQSYIPDIAHAFSNLLVTTGVGTENPYL